MKKTITKLHVNFYKKGKGSREIIIGKIICPKCKNKKVKIFNDNGVNGDHLFHQVVNHFANKNDVKVCPASKMFLRDLSLTVTLREEKL